MRRARQLERCVGCPGSSSSLPIAGATGKFTVISCQNMLDPGGKGTYCSCLRRRDHPRSPTGSVVTTRHPLILLCSGLLSPASSLPFAATLPLPLLLSLSSCPLLSRHGVHHEQWRRGHRPATSQPGGPDHPPHPPGDGGGARQPAAGPYPINHYHHHPYHHHPHHEGVCRRH